MKRSNYNRFNYLSFRILAGKKKVKYFIFGYIRIKGNIDYVKSKLSLRDLVQHAVYFTPHFSAD